MSGALRQAVKAYVYLSILFSIVFWIYLVIDDYVLIEKYWDANWPEYLVIWSIYFLMYSVAFSFYFWAAAVVVIGAYVYVVRPLRREKNLP